MEKLFPARLVLVLSGLVGMVVGAGMLFVPVAFHASAGIVLDGSINLTSEMRAAGGPLLAGGVIIILGAFSGPLRFTALVIACMFYLSYGVSRLLAMAIDGMPAQAIVMITVLELVVGLLCSVALVFHLRTAHRAQM